MLGDTRNKLNKGLFFFHRATAVASRLLPSLRLVFLHHCCVGVTSEAGLARRPSKDSEANLFIGNSDLSVLASKIEQRIAFAHDHIFYLGKKDGMVASVFGTV